MTQDVQSVILASGEPRVTSFIPGEETVTDRPTWFSKRDASAYDLWQIHKRKEDLRREYLEYWEASVSLTGTGRPVDAIISPVAPFTAPPHGKNWYEMIPSLVVSTHLLDERHAQYTTVWNVLDYPALVIPISKVDPNLDKPKPAHAFLSKVDEEHYETC